MVTLEGRRRCENDRWFYSRDGAFPYEGLSVRKSVRSVHPEDDSFDTAMSYILERERGHSWAAAIVRLRAPADEAC